MNAAYVYYGSNNDLQLNIVGLRLQLGQTARTYTLQPKP